MMLRASLLAAATAACLIGLSFAANVHLGGLDRLPMQWGVDGRPNWFAPRWIALSFGPGIGIVAMATVLVRYRYDSDGTQAFRALLPVSAIVISAHAFHLYMLWAKASVPPA